MRNAGDTNRQMYVAAGAPVSERCAIVAAAGGEMIGTRGIVIRIRGDAAAHVKRPTPLMTMWVSVIATDGASTRIEPKYVIVAPAIV